VNQVFVDIYYHVWRRNDLGLPTCAELLRQNNMQSDLQHIELNTRYFELNTSYFELKTSYVELIAIYDQ
jgi:hypothetical protein